MPKRGADITMAGRVAKDARVDSQSLDNNNNDDKSLHVFMRSDVKQLGSLSPIVIYNEVQKICGDVHEVVPQRDGSLLIKAKDASQVRRLLQCRSFNDGFDPVHVSVAGGMGFDRPRSSPRCRGVIYAESFKATRVEDIKDFLSDKGVIEVRKLHKGPEKIVTALLVLTFDGSTLPTDIKIGYCLYNVRPYYPKPFQCFNCYKFGHGKDKCTSKNAVCRKCGSRDHISGACNEVEQCVNCGGGHVSTSRECPKFLEEVAIIKIKIDRGVSFPEAKKIFLQSSSLSGNSYAAAAAAGSSTVVGPGESRSLGNSVLVPVDNATNVWKFVKELVRIIRDGSDTGSDDLCRSLANIINQYGVIVNSDYKGVKVNARQGVSVVFTN